MRCIALVFLLSFCWTLLPSAAQAKGADGVVALNGTIRDVSIGADAVTFRFIGELKFTFFSAAQDLPTRKQIELAFDVNALKVRIPNFGDRQYDSENCPWRVTFKNVGINAKEASGSGETVSIVLMQPTLSYDVNGVLERIDSARGQVLPAHLARDGGDFGTRCRK